MNKKTKLCICFIFSFLLLVTIREFDLKNNNSYTNHEKYSRIDVKANSSTNVTYTSPEPINPSGDINHLGNTSGDESNSNFPSLSGDKLITDLKSPIIQPQVASVLSNTYNIRTVDGQPYSGDFYFYNSNSYNKVDGITTFRGNNYRDSASFGNVNVTDSKLEKIWTNTIGKTDSWTGVGWNGQPVIIRWKQEDIQNMNLYKEFKTKENFVEVIYGALDSKVHFFDLETGVTTRDSISLASSIKGSVTVDPRGYPLLYVGQGINEVSGESVPMGYHIYSLITGEELLFINGRDKYAYLGWGAFDGNPLIDAESDALILPGENGIVYVVKLNTNYDRVNGNISIDPIITRYRYTVNGSAAGMENSIAAYKNYSYFANNRGVVQCLDLNTLTPVWHFQMEDDCDATIGLEEENDSIMLYVGCEVDRRKQAAPSFVRKIDGLTGEALWEYSCECQYDSSTNGGVLSSPIIGKNEISNMVIFNFSKVTTKRDGKMVALDKETGSVIWEKDMPYYSWSSPVAIYEETGKAYIIFGNSIGQLLLINPLTGETIYTLNTGGGNIEGSPAIFENKIVIGTRGKKIYGIEIK